MMMTMTMTMRFLLLGGLSIEPFMQHCKWNYPKDMELLSLGCDVLTNNSLFFHNQLGRVFVNVFSSPTMAIK